MLLVGDDGRHIELRAVQIELAQLPHFSEQNPDISKGWLFFSH
jgi:hypothetical protein